MHLVNFILRRLIVLSYYLIVLSMYSLLPLLFLYLILLCKDSKPILRSDSMLIRILLEFLLLLSDNNRLKNESYY